jgi:hypothetical protein
MNIRTVEQLTDTLSNDLAWRKKELAEVKALVEARNVSDQRHRLLIRSGICILYAHWEGFVKLAANSYLEYIRQQKATYNQLSSNFLALAMKEKLKEAKETNKPSLYIPVCDFFLSELHQRCYLPKEAISTSSNLSSEVFREIVNILGIDFSLYSTKSVLIDIQLLETRNKIAHGNYLNFDREQYVDLHAEVIEMLNIFRNQIENAAIERKFIQNSS